MKECGLKANKSHQHIAGKLSQCFTGLQQQQQQQQQDMPALLKQPSAVASLPSVRTSAASCEPLSVAPAVSTAMSLSSPSWLSLCAQLRDFLRSDGSVYLQLLLLQPLDMHSLLLCVQGAGIDCNRDQLTAFLDVEGVAFAQTPHTRGNRGRQTKRQEQA